MRTEAGVLLLSALCASGSAAAKSFLVGAAPEVTFVGPSLGARVEVLYRPGPPQTRSHLRFAAGFLEGLEFHYIPIALGYRANYMRDTPVQPFLGGGFEYQRRWVSDGPTAHQGALYGELGVLMDVGPLWLGASGGIDVTFLGGLGAGAVLRVHVLWSL